jgi:hypothetical protein
MNTFNELLAYIATNITDAGASYRILPAMVRNSFNWFIDLVREHTEDPAIHTTQEDKDAITAHLNNNDIHLDPADKTKWDNTASNFSIHDANTIIHVTQEYKDAINTHLADANLATPVKHTTQTEKNTWNGKATIKGLESGIIQGNSLMDANNVPNVSSIHQRSYADAPNTINYPNLTDGGFLMTTVLGANYTQHFYVRDGYKIYGRTFNEVQGWQPWKLISAPKIFATGYIDSVTFNGTNSVIKSVLFDDGVTRNVVFNKPSGSGLIFVASLQTSEQIISVLGTGVNYIYMGQFNLFNYNTNQVSFITDYGATVSDLVITIKL